MESKDLTLNSKKTSNNTRLQTNDKTNVVVKGGTLIDHKYYTHQNGITLIALVITIIILLILAGVTINVTLGENGIFNKTKQATEEYKKEGIKEELEVAIVDIQAKKLQEGKEFKREDLQELENIGATIESVVIPAEGEYKDYYFEIDENYVVTIIGKLKGEKPSITGEVITEGIIEQGGKVEIKVTASIGEGTITSITATNGATLKTDTSATEKTFEVIANGKYYFKATAENGRSASIGVEVNTIIEKPQISIKDVTDSSFTIIVNNNYAQGLVTEYKYYVGGTLKSDNGTTLKEYTVKGLSEETEYTNIYVEAYFNGTKLTSQTTTAKTKGEIAEVVWTNNTSSNRTIDGAEATYQNPIIPVGFSAISTEDAKWNKTNGASSEWNNGLVIKNATDGNEFVWVPVDGTNVTYTRWCRDGLSYAICTEIASTSGVDIATNVTDYGGFWVARYEAGLPTNINQTTADDTTRNVSGKPLSIAGAVPWNYIDWNNSKANAESMYTNDYVQSGLINGTQWDTIMKWLQNSSINITNSITWGNYYDSSINLRGGKYAYISDDGGAWRSAIKTEISEGQLIKTGASDDTKVKNIYNLAGNLWEWTCEGQESGYKVFRGGTYVDNAASWPVSWRDWNSVGVAVGGRGFRAQLYIK